MKRLFQELRIWLGFYGYNRYARQIWRAQAEERFATKDIELDLRGRVKSLNSHSYNAYGASIDRLDLERRRQLTELSSLEEKLSFFLPNYRNEIDNAYERLNSIMLDQRQCRQELNAARRRFEDAQAQVDSWYRKSQRSAWLFGNSRRRLPKHSMFGQSFGDLESYKSDRDVAGESIGHIKSERDQLSARFDEVSKEIAILKSKRGRYIELRRAGHSRDRLEFSITKLQAALRDLEKEIKVLTTERDKFVASEKVKRGIGELEARIAEIMGRRRECLERFDDPAEITRRKTAHRELWLVNRGINSEAKES